MSPSTRSAPAAVSSASASPARRTSPTLRARSRTPKLSPARRSTATPVEFRVGTDAIALVVSSENDFLTDVTKDELALVFSTATNWSDVRSEWPAEPIQRFSPGANSGTFDYFVEAVMNPKYVVDADADKGKGEEALLNSAGTQFSEDDNVLVQGVEGSPYAIGYFGFAYYNENKDLLKAVSIDGIAPSERDRRRQFLPALPPPVHLLRPGDLAEQTPGSSFHQLLPHQRQ